MEVHDRDKTGTSFFPVQAAAIAAALYVAMMTLASAHSNRRRPVIYTRYSSELYVPTVLNVAESPGKVQFLPRQLNNNYLN